MAAAKFLLVFELFEDLGNLMVSQKSLVIVTLVERVPGYFDGLCKVAEGQVERIDFGVSGFIVQHNVKFLLLVSLV